VTKTTVWPVDNSLVAVCALEFFFRTFNTVVAGYFQGFCPVTAGVS